MNIHKHTEKLIGVINEYLNEEFTKQSVNCLLKCFLVQKSSKKAGDDFILELCKFQESIDHMIWRYTLTLPLIKENQISYNNLFLNLNNTIKVFCSEIGGSSVLDLSGGTINVILREDPS